MAASGRKITPNSRNLVQEANVARIEAEDAQRKAASVMLGALEVTQTKLARAALGELTWGDLQQISAAIAAAKAAGIGAVK